MRQRPSQSQIPSTSITANPRDIGEFLLAGRRLGRHRGPPRQTVELNIRTQPRTRQQASTRGTEFEFSLAALGGMPRLQCAGPIRQPLRTFETLCQDPGGCNTDRAGSTEDRSLGSGRRNSRFRSLDRGALPSKPSAVPLRQGRPAEAVRKDTEQHSERDYGEHVAVSGREICRLSTQPFDRQ